MNKVYKILLPAMAACIVSTSAVNAQELRGTVAYTLPATSFTFTVDAEISTQIAGPYAKYASRYFDTPATEANTSVCTVKSVTMTPKAEADNSKVYTVSLNPKNGSADMFVQMTKSGLVALAAGFAPESSNTDRGVLSDNTFAGKGLDINSKDNTSIVFRVVQDENGSHEVPVKQTKSVNLTEPQKAEELANAIVDLKNKKKDIITGNTDAEFQGEAMSAVIDEINSLIDEHFTMFYGVTDIEKQTKSFTIVPKDGKTQQYVIFRISDEKGLLPADNTEGRPVIMTVTAEKVTAPQTRGSGIVYRIPANANIRISDGENVLLDARVPVYQLGAESTIVF